MSADLPPFLVRFRDSRETPDPFPPVTEGEYGELEAEGLDTDDLVLLLECMKTQLGNPDLPTPRYLGFVDEEAWAARPIGGGTAAGTIARGLNLLVRRPGSAAVVPPFVAWLAEELLHGPPERRRLLAVIVLEHLDLQWPDGPLRPAFAPWWRNPTLARLLEEAHVRRP